MIVLFCSTISPPQVLQADHILSYVVDVIHASTVENNVKSGKNLGNLHEKMLKTIQLEKVTVLETLIPRVGLLILLEEYYGPLVKLQLPYNVYDTASRADRNDKNMQWRKRYSPNHTLLLGGMKIEEIESFYETLAFRADSLDPLANWFILQQLIKLTRRYKLKGQALLAQEYYSLMFMIASFIYHLKGKKMLDPDDTLDGEGGKWKERIFGSPFDYTTKKTQNQILKYFLIDRPYELVFLVEGETEEAVIELILKARGVDLEKDGFFVYNIRGQSNLEHLKPLFRMSHLVDITIYAMLDNDKEVDKNIDKMKEHARQLGYTKDILIRKWDRDFETENFGIDAVIDKANELIDKKGYNKVSKSDVEDRMNRAGDALIRAIENTIGRVNLDKAGNGGKMSDIVSKPSLAKELLGDRLKEIQITDDPEWNAKLPIEVELKKAFALIPRHL